MELPLSFPPHPAPPAGLETSERGATSAVSAPGWRARASEAARSRAARDGGERRASLAGGEGAFRAPFDSCFHAGQFSERLSSGGNKCGLRLEPAPPAAAPRLLAFTRALDLLLLNGIHFDISMFLLNDFKRILPLAHFSTARSPGMRRRRRNETASVAVKASGATATCLRRGAPCQALRSREIVMRIGA